MYHEEMQMEDDEQLKPKTAKVRKLMSFLDYRNHLFSLSLLLFIIIIFSYLFAEDLGYTFAEISGMNVMTLEGRIYSLAALIFLCGFVYIIHHVDFFGVRQARQSYEKVLRIHFLELGFVGIVFFIWLISLSVQAIRVHIVSRRDMIITMTDCYIYAILFNILYIQTC